MAVVVVGRDGLLNGHKTRDPARFLSKSQVQLWTLSIQLWPTLLLIHVKWALRQRQQNNTTSFITIRFEFIFEIVSTRLLKICSLRSLTSCSIALFCFVLCCVCTSWKEQQNETVTHNVAEMRLRLPVLVHFYLLNFIQCCAVASNRAKGTPAASALTHCISASSIEWKRARVYLRALNAWFLAVNQPKWRFFTLLLINLAGWSAAVTRDTLNKLFCVPRRGDKNWTKWRDELALCKALVRLKQQLAGQRKRKRSRDDHLKLRVAVSQQRQN